LFLQSARRARPGWEPAGGDLQAVARICRLVEGMPLGILLAAAWVEMLTPAEIADEVQHSLDFLETEVRGVPERQRSIRAVFDYAWSLLTLREREVLAALSVFRGGFFREAAQQVAGAGLRDLMGLVNKSLLQRAPTGRYGMHELLRQYAAEKLVEAGIEAEVIDLRSLRPWDRECVLDSVKKTGKLVTVEEGTKMGGVGAEIVAVVAEEGLQYLDAPVKRIAGAESVIPSSAYADQMVIPQIPDIIKEVKELF